MEKLEYYAIVLTNQYLKSQKSSYNDSQTPCLTNVRYFIHPNDIKESESEKSELLEMVIESNEILDRLDRKLSELDELLR